MSHLSYYSIYLVRRILMKYQRIMASFVSFGIYGHDSPEGLTTCNKLDRDIRLVTRFS